jgi:peptidoglycan hydrolase-like protein with peptidoglycan-binding domain
MNQLIAHHYLSKIITSDGYLSPSPVREPSLLLSGFKEKIDELILRYNKYSDDEVYILETYRSNSLQMTYFVRGASKIRKNGMHHYGIAADLVRGKDGKYLDYGLDYQLLRRIAVNELGLTALSFEDAHYQFIPVSAQESLRSAVKSAIIDFQEQMSLSPDGLIGPRTIAKAKEIFCP